VRTEIWRDGGGRARRVSVPETRRERARGLRGRDELAPDEALFLARCRSVHTFGMRFAIDVVLLDEGLTALRVVRMDTGRVLLPRRSVRHILEVVAGSGLRQGERVQMSSERKARLTR